MIARLNLDRDGDEEKVALLHVGWAGWTFVEGEVHRAAQSMR